MEQCGDHLKIYEVKSEKCMGLLYPHFALLNLMSQYLQWQKFNRNYWKQEFSRVICPVLWLHSLKDWLLSKLSTWWIWLQKIQLKLSCRLLLRHHVSMLGATWSMAQQNDLPDRWWRLEARIMAYDHRISVIIKSDDSTNWSANNGSVVDMVLDASEGLSNTYLEGWFTPEWEWIMLPSSLAAGEIKHLSLRPFALIETELWKGQIMDALEGLCLALGKNHFASKHRLAMQIASGWHAMLGIMCTNWIIGHGHFDPHTNWLGPLCSICPLILNIAQHCKTLLMMT